MVLFCSVLFVVNATCATVTNPVEKRAKLLYECGMPAMFFLFPFNLGHHPRDTLVLASGDRGLGGENPMLSCEKGIVD